MVNNQTDQMMGELIRHHYVNGVSLDKFLQHADFKRLTVQQQAEVVKKYGEIIQNNTKFKISDTYDLIQQLIKAAFYGGLAYIGTKKFLGDYKDESEYAKELASNLPAYKDIPYGHHSTVEAILDSKAAIAAGAGALIGSWTDGKVLSPVKSVQTLIKDYKIRKEIHNTDFKDMKESDAIKFLARISTLQK